MKVLFIHPNFPAQFVHLAAALAADPANEVRALGMHNAPAPPGVRFQRYQPAQGAAPAATRHAEGCAQACASLRHAGFEPDVIVAHPGWGDAGHLLDIFPTARLVVYAEYFFDPAGPDVGFDPEAPPLNEVQRAHLRERNRPTMDAIARAAATIAPTQWQASLFPPAARERMHVIHDGIDQRRLLPDPDASMTLATPQGDITLRPGDEVLTYVSRNLEPVRGFHIFMRALPDVLLARPHARVVIAGGAGNSYSYQAPFDRTWKLHMLEEVGARLDLSRVHFTGLLPYRQYAALLKVGKVHAYLTAPFVLSWSFLEAAQSGIRVVASATPPVLEFAQRLGVRAVDFFDTAGWSRALADELARPSAARTPRFLPELSVAHCTAAAIRLVRAVAGP